MIWGFKDLAKILDEGKRINLNKTVEKNNKQKHFQKCVSYSRVQKEPYEVDALFIFFFSADGYLIYEIQNF